MTVTVRVDTEHLHALQRSIDALKLDQALLKHYGCEAKDLALCIDDLEELHDRIMIARDETKRPFQPTRLRSVW